MTDALTTAVHRLTRVTKTKVIQDGDGDAQSVAIVVHMPLLTQLSEAVTSAIGSGGGGGTATGSVLNDAAFAEVFKIRSAIGDWLHIESVRPTRDLVVDLEAWADAFNRTEKEPAFYIRQMEGWADLIINLLDPPTRQEVLDSCPICGANEYTDENGKALGPNPIIIEFRRDRPGDVRAICRACDELWTGVIGVRKLRWDMEQKEVG